MRYYTVSTKEIGGLLTVFAANVEPFRLPPNPGVSIRILETENNDVMRKLVELFYSQLVIQKNCWMLSTLTDDGLLTSWAALQEGR